MLAHGASVKEAAYELGFSDPAYFSRLFKRYTGMNPSEYVAAGVSVEAVSAASGR
jgi:AraC-like DNA-binding protein